MKRALSLIAIGILASLQALAQEPAATDSTGVDTLEGEQLSEVKVSAIQGKRRKSTGIENRDIISASELLRAACCNLGESFSTNPSVDVNYSDAATGVQQIKLLGLSGSYVQMLTENIPNYRGLAAPFSLGYIPGPWMQSIQVSKGSSSVKNGYESITGQINVEFKKPQATPFADANVYYNSKGRLEGNIGANLHLSERWTTALLGHYETQNKAHDDNGDGFADMPKMRQGSLQSRWAWMGDHYVFQASVKGLKEHRESGQLGHHVQTDHPYLIDITNERYEAFTKNAFIFDKEQSTNVALILSGSVHHENAAYGHKFYNADQRNGYASLMFESDFGEHHNLSTGLGINHDRYNQRFRLDNEGDEQRLREDETTPGVYAQYTYKMGEKFVLMGGLRWDHSNIYGGFLTPRAHLKYTPTDILTLRASIGKGYRTPHVLAENNFMLASGRRFVIDSNLEQESAWNYGISAALNLPIAGESLEVNAEYYYTNFLHQLLIDLDADPHEVHFTNLHGDSHSHTWQIEATYPFFRILTLTATYRLTSVKSTYGGLLREKPLTNRYKALLTASLKPGMGKWQIDGTLQLNGGGRLPDAYTNADGSLSWQQQYHAYALLSAQVTRFFRHWSIYAGGENLTGFKQKNPIVSADNPWGRDFDSTMTWGPIDGALLYIGIRLNWNKL